MYNIPSDIKTIADCMETYLRVYLKEESIYIKMDDTIGELLSLNNIYTQENDTDIRELIYKLYRIFYHNIKLINRDNMTNVMYHDYNDDNLTMIVIIYLFRIHNAYYHIHKRNIQRLLIGIAFIAIKYHIDDSISLREYSSYMNISIADLIRLETETLNLLQFKLYIRDEDINEIISTFEIKAYNGLSAMHSEEVIRQV